MKLGTMMLCGALAVPALLAVTPAMSADDFWLKDARVYIISPKDGATVKSPVEVVFGLEGLGVAPAGVDHAMTGHHHLLIDTPAPTGADLEDALIKDEQHVHFGGGQTEASVKLAPGKHTLQLIMGDANHIPHNPPLVSKVVTINVEK